VHGLEILIRFQTVARRERKVKKIKDLERGFLPGLPFPFNLPKEAMVTRNWD
jgi:hypothetical protein